MNTLEIIKTRRSVRTFDGRMISAEHRALLTAYLETIRNPYGIPVEFLLLDAGEYGLSSPVLAGDTLYIAAKAPIVPHSEEAYGYSFEKMVLYAWSLGIGTTWIGGTMDRRHFEDAAGAKEGERMYCVSPLGYPAAHMSEKEIKMRRMIKADERKPAGELFFERDFQTPLAVTDKASPEMLEAVRLAPSAVNMQPWRIVKDGPAYHFYEKHGEGFAGRFAWDVQRIDMGIALCHFLSLTEGRLSVSDPGIPAAEDTEYIATISV